MPGVLCLCVSFKNFVYTYRIFKEKHGYYNIQTVEGVKREIFPNLKELISKFEKPNQGLMFHLVNPIKRTRSCLRWRRSKIELDGIYENSGSDYVDVLPWRDGDWMKRLQKRWVTALASDPASPAGVGLEDQTLGDNLDSPVLSDWRCFVHQLQRNQSPCPASHAYQTRSFKTPFPLPLFFLGIGPPEPILDLLKVLPLQDSWHLVNWERRECWCLLWSLSSSHDDVTADKPLPLSRPVPSLKNKWLGRGQPMPQPLCWSWLSQVALGSPWVMDVYTGSQTPKTANTFSASACAGLGDGGSPDPLMHPFPSSLGDPPSF